MVIIIAILIIITIIIIIIIIITFVPFVLKELGGDPPPELSQLMAPLIALNSSKIIVWASKIGFPDFFEMRRRVLLVYFWWASVFSRAMWALATLLVYFRWV